MTDLYTETHPKNPCGYVTRKMEGRDDFEVRAFYTSTRSGAWGSRYLHFERPTTEISLGEAEVTALMAMLTDPVVQPPPMPEPWTVWEGTHHGDLRVIITEEEWRKTHSYLPEGRALLVNPMTGNQTHEIPELFYKNYKQVTA